jgi:hypothetical protein
MNVTVDFGISPDNKDVPDEISEREIRTFIKTQIPRWLRSNGTALLIEEMEVCSGRARIDIAVIADRLIGIEIKGPKDDVSRLPGQVRAYSQCFDQVVLVMHDALAAKATALIPEWWGVVIGHQRESRLRYRFLRRPQPNPSLNLETRLALLWRNEIDALLADLVGCPAKPRATKKTIRAELLSRIEPPLLRDASLQKLRERIDWRYVPI